MRRRITAIASVIVAVVLVVVSVVVVAAVRGQLLENLDRSLEQRSAELGATLESGEPPRLITSDSEDRFSQILDADGVVVASTPNAGSIDVGGRRPSLGQSTVFSADDLPIEDDAYRVMIRAIDVSGEPGYVVVGENIDDLNDTRRHLVVTLLLVVPSAILLLAATVWWLVGRTLRPVEAIRREVDEIGLDELGRRVPTPATGDEVERLASTMNNMLARLETSAEQQRRFVADASHELRTPLTRLRTGLEVALARTADDAVARSALDDTIEMQDMVDDLLFLARRDATGPTTVRSLVDLDVVVESEVHSMRNLDVPTIDTAAVNPSFVQGNERDLRRLVRNLLSNAVRFANSRVDVEVSETDGRVELAVSDDGPGIPAHDRERVFDRFVRLDDSRSGAGGAGLGLSIVREIARDLSGEAHVADTDRGTRVVVTMPAGGTRPLVPTSERAATTG